MCKSRLGHGFRSLPFSVKNKLGPKARCRKCVCRSPIRISKRTPISISGTAHFDIGSKRLEANSKRSWDASRRHAFGHCPGDLLLLLLLSLSLLLLLLLLLFSCHHHSYTYFTVMCYTDNDKTSNVAQLIYTHTSQTCHTCIYLCDSPRGCGSMSRGGARRGRLRFIIHIYIYIYIYICIHTYICTYTHESYT